MSKKAFLNCLMPLVLAWTLLAVSCGAPDPRTLPNLVAQDLAITITQDDVAKTLKLCFSGTEKITVRNAGGAASEPFKILLGFYDQSSNLVSGAATELDSPRGLQSGMSLQASYLGQCLSVPFAKFRSGQTYFPGIFVNSNGAVLESTYGDNMLVLKNRPHVAP